MKTKLTIALFMVLFTTAATYARQNEEAAVRILPSTEKGILKILYAYDIDNAVEVNFFSEEAILSSDKVRKDTYPHGFLKKYDVRQLKSGSFWVEVSSPTVSVTYKLTKSNDNTITSSLEKTIFTRDLVAKNN